MEENKEIMLIAAGARITMNVAGKINNISGIDIFTPAFEANSSAFCLLFTLTVSEYTLKD